MAQGYDDERFFAAYAEMPRSRHGLRAAGEWRQLRPLFPPLRGRRVLDLGCGYGWHCRFAAEQGAARVRAHLARYDRLTGGQRKANPEHRAGGLQLNTVTRRVFAEGREVVLKNREYELLHFLMLHPDMVFSREELYEKIWGLEAMGDNATVAVHINRVREKIELDPSHPRYIQTVWGAGYRFKGQ